MSPSRPASRSLFRLRRLGPRPLVLLFAALAACGSSKAGSDEYAKKPITASTPSVPGAPAVVVGTTLEADTGEPLAGVLVLGPNGTQAHSNDAGRFELRGIPLGTEGILTARTPDGREGVIRLRPLTGGALEVVLYLRRPAR